MDARDQQQINDIERAVRLRHGHRPPRGRQGHELGVLNARFPPVGKSECKGLEGLSSVHSPNLFDRHRSILRGPSLDTLCRPFSIRPLMQRSGNQAPGLPVPFSVRPFRCGAGIPACAPRRPAGSLHHHTLNRLTENGTRPAPRGRGERFDLGDVDAVAIDFPLGHVVAIADTRRSLA
jgi:hypothetical protein